MRFLSEGPVSDYLTNLKNKAVATYDYYMGKRTNKLGNLEDATAAEIRSCPDLLKICQAFNRANAPYKVQVDRTSKKFLMQFNASQTPKNLIDKFDEKKNGEYTKFIDNYDNNSGVVDLIFDAEDLPDDKRTYEPDVKDAGGTKGVIGKNANKGSSRSESILKESLIIVPDSKEAYDIVKKLGFDGSLEIIESDKGPAISGDNTTLSQFIKEYNNQIGEFDFVIEEAFDPFKESDTEQFTEIESKTVLDMDGFCTDYTMYRNTTTGEYVFVYGDKEKYTPEDSEFDWTCDSEQEAREWFDAYTGFTADEDDDDIKLSICPNCLGNRFSDSTGMCIDCGYDEKSHGDTGTDDLDESVSGSDWQKVEGKPQWVKGDIKIVKQSSGVYHPECPEATSYQYHVICLIGDGQAEQLGTATNIVDAKKLGDTFLDEEILTEGRDLEAEAKAQIGRRVKETYADPYNVGTIIDAKYTPEEGIMCLVEWDYSDRENQEWVELQNLSDYIDDKGLTEAPQIGEPDPSPNTVSIVDLIKGAYNKGLFNNLKYVGRENACNIDISGVDKERLIGFFDSKEEFNREDHNEAGINSVEFISDKFDIEIFDSWMQVYKIPQNESVKRMSAEEFVKSLEESIDDHWDMLNKEVKVKDSLGHEHIVKITGINTEDPDYFSFYSDDSSIYQRWFRFSDIIEECATQSSSVGQHKRGSIDMVPNVDNKDLPEEMEDILN